MPTSELPTVGNLRVGISEIYRSSVNAKTVIKKICQLKSTSVSSRKCKTVPRAQKEFFYLSHIFAKLAFGIHQANLDVKKKPDTVSFSTCPPSASPNLVQINARGSWLNCSRWRVGWSERQIDETIIIMHSARLSDSPALFRNPNGKGEKEGGKVKEARIRARPVN